MKDRETADRVMDYIFAHIEHEIQLLESLGENDERYHLLHDTITNTINRITGGRIEFELIPKLMDNNRTCFTVQFGKIKP